MQESAQVDPRLLGELDPAFCAACVGRVFARLGEHATNEARGRTLRPAAPAPSDACPLCEGIAGRVERYAALCLDASREVEHESFLVGSVYFREIRAREDLLFERLVAAAPEHRRPAPASGAAAPAFDLAEYLKAEVNREIGKRIEAATGRRVDFDRPHVTYEVDTRFDHVRLQIASVFVRGRYLKRERDLPQTRWPCRACEGLGCRKCNFVGKTYAESVEELVAAPFLEASSAAGESFHGMGREDIDARMLGTGRPFVLELKSPRKRTLAWTNLAFEVAGRSNGRVEVLEIAPTDAGAPARYKQADPGKTYRVRCVAETNFDGGSLIKLLPSFRGLQLEQRTPERVAHRRADLVRRRRIHEVALVALDGSRFELEIRAESGTYIKEFVSGDQGRTRPSLSEALGVPCRVEELDVIDIDWKE